MDSTLQRLRAVCAATAGHLLKVPRSSADLQSYDSELNGER